MEDVKCVSNHDCAACRDGKCQALINTDFGSRDCPFYKSKEQNMRELLMVEKRLKDQSGKSPFFFKYHGSFSVHRTSVAREAG